MKLKTGAYLIMMFGLTIVMTACGGGGGGGGAAGNAITVTAAKNPVLINTPVTVTANFITYTSTVKFGANKAIVGSPVHFTVSPAATLSNQTTIKADFTATVDLTAPAGTYTVSASLNSAAGSALVAFIPQPGSASVVVAPQQALTGIGGLTCDVTSDMTAVFRKYSSAAPSFSSGASSPLASTLPVSVTTVTPPFISAAGFNATASSTLVNLLYNMTATPGVPNFSVGNVQATLASPIVLISPAPVLTLTPTYFSGLNGTGTKLYP
jgi:hypothetical protein